MKVLVGAFNQALVGGFSLIVKTDGLFAALVEMMISHPRPCPGGIWLHVPPYDRGSPGPGQAALLSSPVACHLQIVKTRRNKPAEVEVSSE